MEKENSTDIQLTKTDKQQQQQHNNRPKDRHGEGEIHSNIISSKI